MNVGEYILLAFPAIFVILNPFMAATSFLMLTQGFPEAQQSRVARRACLTAFLVSLLFAIAGHLIFQIFHITVEAFRIAGGIILFTVGLNMLQLQPLRIKQTEEEKAELLIKRQNQDVGAVPLGLPIMCGPGTITTVIVLMAEIKWDSKFLGLLQAAGLIVSIALACVLFYFIMIHSKKLLDLLKITGIGVLTRIMGLILTVIATQFVINGIRDLIPKLAQFATTGS